MIHNLHMNNKSPNRNLDNFTESYLCSFPALNTCKYSDRVRYCHLEKESINIISFSKLIDFICGREQNFGAARSGQLLV